MACYSRDEGSNEVAQKRILILDESELIMVVDKDVVKQVDENRGEMNRTEFVNFLIQSQLKEYSTSRNYIDKEEFHQFALGIKELLRNFLEFFLSYGLELGRLPQFERFDVLRQQLQSLDSSDEETGEP